MSIDVTLEVGDSVYPGRLDVSDGPSDQGVLMIPGAGHGPFGDVFLRFGRAAAGAGYHVARFETWMTPDEVDAKTEADFRAEIEAGVEFLRSRGCETIAVVAKSFGGRLALSHLPEGVDRLVVWALAVLAEGIEDAPERLLESDLIPSVAESELAAVDVPVRVL